MTQYFTKLIKILDIIWSVEVAYKYNNVRKKTHTVFFSSHCCYKFHNCSEKI